MESPSDVVRQALEGIRKVTVFSHTFDADAKQINLLFRVGEPTLWLAVVDAILMEEERLSRDGTPPWNVHICKHYIRHNGALRYGWNITIQANADVPTAVNDLCRLLVLMARHTPTETRRSAPPAPAPEAPSRRKRGGGGSGGRVIAGEVVEMPLIGETADRNAPQAPVWTPGGGGGKRSGRSSKGAHLIGPPR